jgi:hypothetical protein
MTQATPGRIDRALWSDPKFKFLEGLRQEGDPEADAAVQRFVEHFGKDKAIAEAQRFMESLVRRPWPTLEDAQRALHPKPGHSAALEEFLQKHAVLPSWAEPERIKQGQKLFERHGPMAVAALLCASLPECYSHKNGALVLWHTQRLQQHSVRRIYETARILLDVMTPGGLEPGGKAALTAVKTRLLHAVMRYLVLTDPPRQPKDLLSLSDELLYSQWDPRQWGVPINQEDNAFTLLTFSYIVLRSWKRMKLPISDAEADAYQHCWNVVGHYLGIRPDLYATSWDDAEFMWKRLQAHQQAPSAEGRSLTAALVPVMQEIVPDEYLAQRIEYTLMRFFMSSHTADVLGLPPEEFFDHIIKLGIDLWKLLNEGANIAVNVATKLNQHLPIPIPPAIPRAIDAFAWKVGATVTRILVRQLRPSRGGSEKAPQDVRQNLREKLRQRREGNEHLPRTVEELVDHIGQRFVERMERAGSQLPQVTGTPPVGAAVEGASLKGAAVEGAAPEGAAAVGAAPEGTSPEGAPRNEMPRRPGFQLPPHLREAWKRPLKERLGRDFTPLS